MEFRSIGNLEAWSIQTESLPDARGTFREVLSTVQIERSTGRTFQVSQINASRSTRGVIRGIHFARRPPGQAKYVMCLVGEVWDVIVDLRAERASFGSWSAITLSDGGGQAALIPEGFGHAFFVESEVAVVVYATTTPFMPECEFAISPFDPELGITWPGDVPLVLSDRDQQAPFIAEMQAKHPEVFLEGKCEGG